MNPDDLKLETLNKLFEYERISRELDTCTNIDLMRNICRCYVKLYLGLEEYLQKNNHISIE